MAQIHYPNENASLPDATIEWLDYSGAVINLTSYTSFTVRIARDAGGTSVITKTSGIVGYATSPNLQIAWADNELSSLSAGNWVMEVEASTADGRSRFMQITLVIDGTSLV